MTPTAPHGAEALHTALRHSPVVYGVLQKLAAAPDLPACWVGAGCVAQTVWNHQCGNPPLHGINTKCERWTKMWPNLTVIPW